jgi:hypothetical protein
VSENGIRSVPSIQKKISAEQAGRPVQTPSRCAGQHGKLRSIVNRRSSSRAPIYDHAGSPPHVRPYPQSLNAITPRNHAVFQHL